MDHHWIVFFRAVFPNVVAASERRFAAMPGADIWRFCPSQRLDENGLPTFASDVWCGMAAFDTERAAHAAYSDPVGHLPYLDEVESLWTALAIPFAHRGTVMWRDAAETGSALRVAPDPREGTLAVVTSAGFDAESTVPLERRKAFLAGIEAVVRAYAEAPGNLHRDVANGAGVDGRDGLTLSLWDADSAMMVSAYKTGVHRGLMDDHFGTPMFDRSSFTRLRVRQSRGDWGRAAAPA